MESSNYLSELAKERIESSTDSSMNIAKLINHQHKIIEQVQQVAKLIENLDIAKAELRNLMKKGKDEILREFNISHQTTE